MPLETINDGIQYTELLDSGYTFTPSLQEAYRTVNVAGASLYDFNKAMLGYSKLVGGQIRRLLPEHHPEFLWLYAQEVAFVEPLGTPGQAGLFLGLQFQNVKLRVTYRSLPYAVLEDGDKPENVTTETWRFVEKTETLAIESTSVPGGTFEYEKRPGVAGNGVPIPEPPGVMVPSHTVIYRWYQVPCLDRDGTPRLPLKLRAAHEELEGKINSVKFDDRYPPLTLLCLAPEVEFFRQVDGSWAANITYQFAGRGREDLTGLEPGVESDSPNWDRILRSNRDDPRNAYKFAPIVLSADRDVLPVFRRRIYSRGDFARLFQF